MLAMLGELMRGGESVGWSPRQAFAIA